jgi:hypothetical protein
MFKSWKIVENHLTFILYRCKLQVKITFFNNYHEVENKIIGMITTLEWL